MSGNGFYRLTIYIAITVQEDDRYPTITGRFIYIGWTRGMPEPNSKPFVLIIRDGWGVNPHPEHDAFNAVKLAQTPNCDKLLDQYPWTLIHTSGEDVGLPKRTMGNSEVGHQNLGAGRIVDQDSVRISKAIRQDKLVDNHVLVDAIKQAQANNKYVHLLGIASDAGVHGLLTHLYACLELCKQLDHDRVALHLFTDGRDTGPFTGKQYVADIESRCNQLGVGRIGSVCGRFYAMDRDNRWQRVEQAYSCLTGIHARKLELPWAASADEAIQRYYDQPISQTQKGDEFITPTMIGSSLDDCLSRRISDGDTVIFYNYRGDRPREIVKAFTLPDEQWSSVPPSPENGQQGFNRTKQITLTFVTMTAYEQGLPVQVAFPKLSKMADIAGQYLSDKGFRQFRCAETEKFPHVTFFFNDYREQPFPGESRQMAQSPKVSTYDQQPEMSAYEICELVLKRLDAPYSPEAGCEDFILVNFANGDMVGHTGNLDATVKAIETVDRCVGRIVEATLARHGVLIVTADHGNAEQMFDPQTKSPHTAHTLYDVECIIVAPNRPSATLRKNGRLADVMPTMLDLMGLRKPDAMTGQSLLAT